MHAGIRRGVVIAAGACGRVAFALLASVALHWGAWQVAGASPARAAAAPSVLTMRLVPPAIPAADVPPAPVPVATGEAAAPVAADRLAAPDGPMMPTVTVTGPRSVTLAAKAPARPSPAPEPAAPTFLEAWEVDVPAEFLVPPLAMDELPEQVGEAVRAGVALRVDASGRLVDLEVSVVGEAPAARDRLR
ncbi:MAG: hypothetical protein ACOYLX_11460, partial [Burkholderiaceae bacterium]